MKMCWNAEKHEKIQLNQHWISVQHQPIVAKVQEIDSNWLFNSSFFYQKDYLFDY